MQIIFDKTDPKVFLTFRAEQESVAAMDKLCAEHGVNRSQFLRAALRKMIEILSNMNSPEGGKDEIRY